MSSGRTQIQKTQSNDLAELVAKLPEVKIKYALLVSQGVSERQACRLMDLDENSSSRYTRQVKPLIDHYRQERDKQLDISKEAMISRLFQLLNDADTLPMTNTKPIEIKLKVLQELNKMAGNIIERSEQKQMIQQVSIVYTNPETTPPPMDQNTIDIEIDVQTNDQDITDQEASSGT